MIQFSDHIHAIHDDRRRRFEAAAGRAVGQADGRPRLRRARPFRYRRGLAGRRRSASVREGPAG